MHWMPGRRIFALLCLVSLLMIAAGCSKKSPSNPFEEDETTPPLVPFDVRGRAVATDKILLTWLDRSHYEDGYEIYESVGNDTNFVSYQKTAANVDSVVFTGKDPDESYYYRVRSFNANGNSNLSGVGYVLGNWSHLTIRYQSGPVLSVAYSPDGRYLATGSGDFAVKIWNPVSGALMRTLASHTRIVEDVGFSPTGRYFVSVSNDSTVRVYETDFWAQVRHYRGHRQKVSDLAFSPEDTIIATGGGDEVHIWRVQTGTVVHRFANLVGNVGGLSFTPDGRFLAVGFSERSIHVFDASDGTETASFRAHSGAVNAAAFSSDGRYLISGGFDEKVNVWRGSGDFQLLTTFDVNSPVFGLASSHDGRYFCASLHNGMAMIWEATTFELVRLLTGHETAAYDISFDQGSRFMATASGDQTIRIWGPIYSK